MQSIKMEAAQGPSPSIHPTQLRCLQSWIHCNHLQSIYTACPLSLCSGKPESTRGVSDVASLAIQREGKVQSSSSKRIEGKKKKGSHTVCLDAC